MEVDHDYWNGCVCSMAWLDWFASELLAALDTLGQPQVPELVLRDISIHSCDTSKQSWEPPQYLRPTDALPRLLRRCVSVRFGDLGSGSWCGPGSTAGPAGVVALMRLLGLPDHLHTGCGVKYSRNQLLLPLAGGGEEAAAAAAPAAYTGGPGVSEQAEQGQPDPLPPLASAAPDQVVSEAVRRLRAAALTQQQVAAQLLLDRQQQLQLQQQQALGSSDAMPNSSNYSTISGSTYGGNSSGAETVAADRRCLAPRVATGGAALVLLSGGALPPMPPMTSRIDMRDDVWWHWLVAALQVYVDARSAYKHLISGSGFGQAGVAQTGGQQAGGQLLLAVGCRSLGDAAALVALLRPSTAAGVAPAAAAGPAKSAAGDAEVAGSHSDDNGGSSSSGGGGAAAAARPPLQEVTAAVVPALPGCDARPVRGLMELCQEVRPHCGSTTFCTAERKGPHPHGRTERATSSSDARNESNIAAIYILCHAWLRFVCSVVRATRIT